ncbi:MAG: hypothetical protein ACUVV0_03755 [Anaerolineae bacterium]
MVKEEEKKEFVFEDWLEEGMEAFRARLRRGFLPEEFHEHLRAARKETLLAVRSLLDDAIRRMEEHPKKKATKIKVE